MSALVSAVEDYLGVRRSLGFALRDQDRLLGGFVAYLDSLGLDVITTEAALAWAVQPVGADPSWHAKRLGYVRRFAVYLHALDDRHEVPPRDLLANQPRRVRPYVYTDDEIGALMAAARVLAPRLRAATFETVIGLMTVSGMRPGEVLRLDRSNVDLVTGLVSVLDSKFHHSRELPLHPSAVAALADYSRLRDKLCANPGGPSFFVSLTGARVRHGELNATFVRLVRAAGLEPPPDGGRRPRPHDFRHRFAVHTVHDWYRAGVDAQARLAWLSTYLGHVEPAGTYWYLSATPELLALAARRVEQHRDATP